MIGRRRERKRANRSHVTLVECCGSVCDARCRARAARQVRTDRAIALGTRW